MLTCRSTPPTKRWAHESGSGRVAAIAHRDPPTPPDMPFWATQTPLVSKPTNMVETWNVRETTTFIRDLAEYVTRGMLLFEAITIDACGSATLLSRK